MEGGINLYIYGDNNPNSFIDPYGLIAKFCKRRAFVEGEKRKGKKYIPGLAHCYLVANETIFSWHPSWAGGVTSNEYPETNDCTELHCSTECDGSKDKELEDCIYESGLSLKDSPGWLYGPTWDCCDVARAVVRNCKAQLGCK